MTEADKQELREKFLEAAAAVLRESEDPTERMSAAGVLGTLGNEEYVDMLLRVLQEDDSRQVQHKVSQALARIGGEAACDGLQELMYVDNQYTRFLAAEALSDIMSNGSV